VRDFSSQPRPQAASAAQKVVVGLAALVLLASATYAFGAWRDSSRVRARLEQARAESQAAQARARAFETRGDAGQLLAAQALLTADAPPSRVVAELSRLMPGDVKVDDLRLAYGSRLQLEMRVSAREAASYDLFLDRLEHSPLFSDVLPGDENREGELRALVRAVWRGTGA
jgi:hypothetical protein